MKEFLKENKYLIILWLLCILALFMYCGHYSGILIDFGREVYYPEEILNGKVLYKDLFNIYGPLAYQINAVLYKLFGAKLLTLYGAGWICSLLTVSGIYLVSQKFLSRFLSFCIGLFTISVGVATTGIFNFHFPYSWAVLYGLIAFLYSLYFLIDKKNLSLSAFLAGFAVTCKYDFLLYLVIILFFVFKNRDWKALLSMFVAPALSFGILFMQGLSISDLANSLSITAVMAKTKTLAYFYQNSGIYFHPKALIMNFVLFLKTAVPFAGILYGVYKNKKLLLVIFCILAFIFRNTETIFGFLPVLLTILIIVNIFNRKNDIKIAILSVSVLAVCAKVFWVLCIGNYGNYYVSIALIGVLAILFTYIPKNLEKTAGIYLIVLSCFMPFMNANQSIETNKGKIVTSKYYAGPTNNLIDYINQNTKPTDKIVIFPEGMMINFLTDRKSDDFYNSMLPLYVETFGEDKIIEHFKLNMPEYFVFSNLNMKNYYFEYICQDYALNFCGFVKDNYYLAKTFDGDFRYFVFKKKL